ncbi:unknown [Fusobacterium sp. CAG:439]|nr:unknown [Fusobacterium sp. CAG:439]
MKKILGIILGLLMLQNVCLAQTGVSFVYINGSNNNDEKMRNWYIEGVQKLHPVMKKKFEKNKEIKQVFLDKTQYKINEEPVIFFWGDKSQKDLEFVQGQLDLTKAFSPTIAYKVRSMLAAYLHDAIWVQKQHNMLPILDELNDTVIKEAQKGNKTVLYGYSAGSFVTYEYMFNKLPYLNPEELFNEIDVSDNVRKFASEHPLENTCISALSKAEIGTVSQSGHLILKKFDDNSLEENYLKLREATKTACAPAGSLQGVVNFASPLVLFYSDLADPDYELTYYNKLMLKYIIENGLFFITVNYREDPLGFPSTKNLTIDEMEKLANIEIENPKGFVYDNSSVWSKRSVLFAHTSYWSAKRTFSNAVVKAFTNGYRLQYDKEFQEKVLKNNRKKVKFEMI